MVIGIAVIAAIIHLLFGPVFQTLGRDVDIWVRGDSAYSEPDAVGFGSPAGLLFSVLIELVIAIGSVVILVALGIWDLIQVGVAWTTDVLNIANENLEDWKKGRTGEQVPSEVAPAVAATAVATAVVAKEEEAPAPVADAPTFEQVLLHAVKDTREGSRESDKKLAMDLTRQINAEVRLMLAKYEKVLLRMKNVMGRLDHLEAELGIVDIDPLNLKAEEAAEAASQEETVIEDPASEDETEDLTKDKTEDKSNGNE